MKINTILYNALRNRAQSDRCFAIFCMYSILHSHVRKTKNCPKEVSCSDVDDLLVIDDCLNKMYCETTHLN